MVTVLSPDNMIQMTATTWTSFQWWFSAWQYTAIIEAIAIIVLIAYFGRNHWRNVGRSIFIGLKNVNNFIIRSQREQWGKEEMPIFGIGKFWAFVFSGFFTMIALNCNLIVAYFAVLGRNIAIGYSSEAIQIAASNALLFQLGVIQNFLWMAFIISIVVIFRDYIELLLRKLREGGLLERFESGIPDWFYRGLRYSILILFTTVSFLAFYCGCLMLPYSSSGSYVLTSGLAQYLTPGSSEQIWCGLAGIVDPFAFFFLAFWICSVWLLAFGYLLKPELDHLWKIVRQIPKWVYVFITASDLRV